MHSTWRNSPVAAVAALCSISWFAAPVSGSEPAPAALPANVPAIDAWRVVGPWGGTATAIAVDPKDSRILLAGGRNSLLFRSDDSGEDWRILHFPKRQFGEVSAILIDPANSRHYLVGLGGSERGGLFESADAGLSWTPIEKLRETGVRALAIAPSATGIFAAATATGIYRTTDAGKTWDLISDPDNLEMHGTTTVAFDPANPEIIYAGTAHLPWKTTDGGKTWESIHQGMIDDSDVFSIHVDPAEPQRIFASACSGIYTSLNRGGSWHKLMGIPNTHRRTHIIRQDPGRPATIYAGTTLGLFRSDNFGAAWKQLTFDQVNWLAFDPERADRMYLAVEGQGVFLSTDRGQTVMPLTQGFVDRRLSAAAVGGNRLIAVEAHEGSTSGIFASEDAGAHWARIGPSAGLEGVHLEFIAGFAGDNKTLIAGSLHALYQSHDGGVTWKPLEVVVRSDSYVSYLLKKARPNSAASGRQPVTLRKFAFHQVHGLYTVQSGTQQFIYAATDHGLLSTLDRGATWMAADIPGTESVDALFVSPSSDGRMVARGTSLFYSEDYGLSWRSIGFPRDLAVINEIALAGDRSSPWLAAMADGLFESPDEGGHWYRLWQGVPISTFDSVVYNPSDAKVAYAVEFGQLYETRDAGASWHGLDERAAYQFRHLWIPATAPDRVFGLTNEFGFVFREWPKIR
jgi:photosystem II stability/assembly factor-like uncharacterized protein